MVPDSAHSSNSSPSSEDSPAGFRVFGHQTPPGIGEETSSYGAFTAAAPDPQALALAIGRVISEPALARSLVASGRVTASTHGRDRLTDRVMHAYHAVLRSDRRGVHL